MTKARTGNVRKVLQYLLSLIIAIGLLYLVFRKQSLSDIWESILEAEWYLIAISLAMGLISHVIRAYRWNLLFAPLGHKPRIGVTFLAVMVAYIANLILPRAGEVARCAFLDRKAGIPTATGFGTVVVERLVDLLALLVVMLLVFLTELDNLLGFFQDQFQSRLASLPVTQILSVLVITALVLGGALLWWLFRMGGKEVLMRTQLYQRLAPILNKFMEGLVAVRKMERPLRFWAATVVIWALYFGMTYVVVLAYPATVHLTATAGLALLVVGGFGMAAPVQGGFGAYHIFVASFLIIYGVPIEEGKIFAALLHSTQTALILVIGSLALLIGFFIPRHANSSLPKENSQPATS